MTSESKVNQGRLEPQPTVAWPKRPEHIRQAVLALIRGTFKEQVYLSSTSGTALERSKSASKRLQDSVGVGQGW